MPNGIIKINSSTSNRTLIIKSSKHQPNEPLFVELLEQSQVKYECLQGFKLKSSSTASGESSPAKFSRKKESSFVEKCESTDSSDDSSLHLDYLNELDYDLSEFSRSSRQISILSKIVRHECSRYCEPFKINHALSKLFVVPLRRELFFPGEKLMFHCNEGYIAAVLNDHEYVQRFDLECDPSGKWHLKNYKVPAANGTYVVKSLEVTKLPICFSVDKLRTSPRSSSNNASDLFLSDFSYGELNVRTFSMIILFCGLLFSIVILCLTIINYYNKRFAQRNFLLAPSDASLLPAESAPPNLDHRLLNQESLINRSLPLAQEASGEPQVVEPCQNSNNDSSQLPTYAEATACVPRGQFNFQFNSNLAQPIIFERSQANTIK